MTGQLRHHGQRASLHGFGQRRVPTGRPLERPDGHREQQDWIGIADCQERVGRDHFVAVAVSEIGSDVFEPIDSLLVRRGGEIVE